MFPRMLRMCRVYMGLVDRHPWWTQSLTTAGLMGGGDFIAQVFVSKRRPFTPEYDLGRTFRFLGTGFFVFAPGMHIWYSYLDRRIQGSLAKRVVVKLLLDQSFFLPAYIVVFIVLMGAMRGDGRLDIEQQLRTDYKDTQLTSWAVWVPVQAGSFLLLPGQFRVICINIVNLFWNTYMSWVAEKK